MQQEKNISHVSKNEACALLEISRPTLNNWLKSEKVPLNIVFVGLRKRISLKEIQDLKKDLISKNY